MIYSNQRQFVLINMENCRKCENINKNIFGKHPFLLDVTSQQNIWSMLQCMISSTPPLNHEHGYILYTFINEVGVNHLVEKVTFNRGIQ